MLSFDCAPFVYQNQFPGFDLFGSQRRTRVVRPQRRSHCPQYHHGNHHQHQHQQQQHQHTVHGHTDPFQYLLQVADARVQVPSAPKVEVNSRVVQSADRFQIQVLKENDPSNSFKDYSINYKRTIAGNTLISIECEGDSFEKTYSFKSDGIDIGNVDWRTQENLLLVDIPKVRASPLKKSVKVMTHRVKKTASPQAEQPQPEPQPKRKISIPISAGYHSEQELKVSSTPSSPVVDAVTEDEQSYPSDTESLSTPSNVSSDSEDAGSSSKLPKLTRKVSIEEVEDESLHQMDLD